MEECLELGRLKGTMKILKRGNADGVITLVCPQVR